MDEILRTNKASVRTSSGLIYEIIVPGDGTRPKNEDDLLVMEWQMLKRDGGRVATLEKPEGETMHRKIALKDMMPGMAEGVGFIGKGGKIKLHIPPTLVYKEDEEGALFKEIIFIVELKDVCEPSRK